MPHDPLNAHRTPGNAQTAPVPIVPAAPAAPHPFVHLHVHSEFSLLSGVPKIKELVAHAKALGMKSLALTDTNRMSGLILFYNECKAHNIHPILGVELNEASRPGETVVLLARDAEGYGDLCELITRRQKDPAAFTFAKAFAKEWPRLICLTAFPRPLKTLCESPNRPHLYGELLRHSAEARERGKGIEALCEAWNLPTVAAGDCRFLVPADFEAHRILRAIDLNSTLSRLKAGETAPEGAWLRSGGQMDELFHDRPQALANAARIAQACNAELELGKWIMPKIHLPHNVDPNKALARAALQGLWRKYGNTPRFAEARAIQEMELATIRKLGYSSYFLMVKEVRDWASRTLRGKYRRARDCSILRGSGANSITFYNLGVCNLDPIALKLYFQRFLNEDRAAPPDADLDFGWDERARALKWMADHFGRDRVAITCTTNTFRGRAAFRETAKVFGYSDEQVSTVLDSFETKSRRLDDDQIRGILAWAERLRGKPRFLGQHPGGLIITNRPIWRHVACEWSRNASGDSLVSASGEGAAGQHGGAFSAASKGHKGLNNRGGRDRVDADGPDGARLITQIDMHNGLDDLGLIKFDLLGNGSLSVLRDTLFQVEEQGLPDPEVWDVRKCFNDPAMPRMMAESRTRGVFYIESPAQMRLNQRAKAETFPEIVITSSLIRPAGTAYCKTFVERHRKMKENRFTGQAPDWEFLHPSLQPLLDETHDVCAFQEDVIRICHEVAGLSYKLSDRIRKMMNSQHEGAPDEGEWNSVRRRFLAGCMDPDRHKPPFTLLQAGELWKRVSSFTGFSFCKSHSASYAELSFQCAHLKSRYPAQFLSSVISNRHGFYNRDVYLDEARRWGLKILPLDVNVSRLAYHGRDNWIRPGLSPVRDCREAALKVLVQEREADGPFKDLLDLLKRVPLHKREAENLILAGGMGGFGMTQPELLYLLDAAYAKIRPAQGDLFGGFGDAFGTTLAASVGPGSAAEAGRRRAGMPSGFTPAGLRDYSLMQKCMNELRMLGYVLSANLLDVVENHVLARDAVRASDLRRHVGRRVKVLGVPVTDRLHPVAHSGEYMKFLTLGDNTGYLDVIFWPKALEKWGDVLAGQAPFSGSLLEVWGKVSEEWGTFSVEAEAVRIAEWLPNQVDFEAASRRLQEGLKSYPGYVNGMESLAA
ncbi:MAG TPA: PHP domain-containing protein [Fibrobacteria bacterium]|nr:PHP domain-containing protein [Fibrobacteria bacterium]